MYSIYRWSLEVSFVDSSLVAPHFLLCSVFLELSLATELWGSIFIIQYQIVISYWKTIFCKINWSSSLPICHVATDGLTHLLLEVGILTGKISTLSLYYDIDSSSLGFLDRDAFLDLETSRVS